VNYDNNSPLPKEVLDKYLVEKVYLVTILNSTQKTKQEIKFKPCEKGDLYTKYNNPETDYGKFSKWRCLANRNFTLQGGFNDNLFKYIEYAVFFNYTSFSNEKMTFMNNFFGKTLVNVVVKYFEMGIDVDNYDQPLRTYDFNIFDYVSFSKVKKVNLDFSRFEFQNDNQILFGEANSEFFLKLGSQDGRSYDMFDRNPNASSDFDLLFKYYIRSSNNVSIVRRGYQKLWDLLSNIGGLVGQILFCIVFINTFYNKFKSREELVNNLLKFKDNYNINKNTYNEIKRLQDLYITKISSEKNFEKNTVSDFSEKFTDCDIEAFGSKHKHKSSYAKPKENHLINDESEFGRIGSNKVFALDMPQGNEISQNKRVGRKAKKKNSEINSSLYKNNINNENLINEYNAKSPNHFSSNNLLKTSTSKSPQFEGFSGKDFSLSNHININKNNNLFKKKNLFSSFLNKNDKNYKNINNCNKINYISKDRVQSITNNTKIVKVDNIKRKSNNMPTSQNEQNESLDMDKIKIEMIELSEKIPAKVTFMNRSLNSLRNSIFTDHSNFLMRKLISIKDVNSVKTDPVNENNIINNNVNSDVQENETNNIKYVKDCNDDNYGKNANNKNESIDRNHLLNQQIANEKYTDITANLAKEDIIKRDEDEENKNRIKSEENVNSVPFTEEECNERISDKNVVYSFCKNSNMNDNYSFKNRINNANTNNKFSFKCLDNFIKNHDPEEGESAQDLKDPPIPKKEIYSEQKQNKITEFNYAKKHKITINNSEENFESVPSRADYSNIIDAALGTNKRKLVQSAQKNSIVFSHKNMNENKENFNPETNLNQNYNENKNSKLNNIIVTNLTITSKSKYGNCNNLHGKETENQSFPKTRYEKIHSNRQSFDFNSEKAKIEFFQENEDLQNEIITKKTTINKEENKKEKIHFDFSVLDIFCKCLCFFKSKRNKFQLYKRSYKSINEHLNIYFYLKLIQEIEIIKSLVFSYEQIGLVNFVSKPMIFNEVNSNLQIDEKQINEIFKQESSLENALQFFREIINQMKFNDIDHKLIKIFLYEFESIIDYEKKYHYEL